MKTLSVTIPVSCEGSHDARAVLRAVSPKISELLSAMFGFNYDVRTDELTDPASALGEYGKIDEKDVTLMQSFYLFSGWQKGASLTLKWFGNEPGTLTVCTEGYSKIEDRLLTIVVGAPCLLFTGLALISTRFQFFKLLLGLMVGGAIGGSAYHFFLEPLTRFLLGAARHKNGLLARRLLTTLQVRITSMVGAGSEGNAADAKASSPPGAEHRPGHEARTVPGEDRTTHAFF